MKWDTQKTWLSKYNVDLGQRRVSKPTDKHTVRKKQRICICNVCTHQWLFINDNETARQYLPITDDDEDDDDDDDYDGDDDADTH